MSAVSTRDASGAILDNSIESGVSRLRVPSSGTVGAVLGDGSAVQQNDDTVIGSTAGLRDVVARIEQVAPTDAPVLFEGETGSGKELLARLLHGRSRRASAPMIRVNCGAIPAELIDSELFGHERGSFTGATSTRQGWFERADGGTLFLDEVAELTPAAQVRLLRVLQEGTFTRVGGEKALHVSVRVITATHRDLRAMCGAGTFRDDLFYRIGVFTVRIPPLRDRRADIEPLAEYFARTSGIRLTGVPLPPSSLTASDRAALLRYPWPGNVRELGAVIERAAILGGGRRLEIAAALGDAPSAIVSAPETILSLDDAIRAHIIHALELTHGRIEGRGGAADLLGVNPHSLRGKMRRLGIEWQRYRS